MSVMCHNHTIFEAKMNAIFCRFLHRCNMKFCLFTLLTMLDKYSSNVFHKIFILSFWLCAFIFTLRIVYLFKKKLLVKNTLSIGKLSAYIFFIKYYLLIKYLYTKHTYLDIAIRTCGQFLYLKVGRFFKIAYRN